MSPIRKLVAGFAVALCVGYAVTTLARGSTSITLSDGSYVVPKGHVWKIVGVKPYKSETGIGTADLSIDGQAQVGEDRGYTIYGKFELTFSHRQRVPFWILEDSKVSLGDSRGTLTVQDFVDN